MIWEKLKNCKKQCRICAIAGLLGLSYLACVCFETTPEMGIVIHHIYYIPIVLSAVWWRKKGLLAAGISSILLIIGHDLFKSGMLGASEYFQIFMFIAVSFITVRLAEQMEKAREYLSKANQQLRDEQEKLHQNSARYKAVFDFTVNGITIYEAVDNGNKFVFQDINPAAESMEHVTKQDILGREAQYVFPNMGNTDFLDVLKRVWKSGKTEYYPSFIYQAKGVTRWGENHIVKLLSGEVMVIYKDITQLKLAEEQLRQSVARYKAMFDFTMNGVAIYEAVNGGSDFIFKDFNPAAEKIEKVKKQDLLGKRIQDVFPGVEEMGLVDALTRVWKTGEEEYLAATIYKDEQNQGWRENHVFKLPSGEVMAIYKDLTELKNAEEQLENNQNHLQGLAVQLSLSEEIERRRIAEGLHDNIIQPLVFLDVKLKTLLDSYANDELADSYRKMRTVIKKLINDIRDFTFDLSFPVLHELGFEKAVKQWLVNEVQEKHGLETVFKDDGKVKPLDDSVKTFLFNAVKELLVNSVKHAKAKKIEVSLAKEQNNILIYVKDDGVGFDFNKKPVSKISGFGLFNIRNRIEYLGGSFEIKSGQGSGVEAVISMPLKMEKSIQKGMEQ